MQNYFCEIQAMLASQVLGNLAAWQHAVWLQVLTGLLEKDRQKQTCWQSDFRDEETTTSIKLTACQVTIEACKYATLQSSLTS